MSRAHDPPVTTVYSAVLVACSAVLEAEEMILRGIQHLRRNRRQQATSDLMLASAVAAAAAAAAAAVAALVTEMAAVSHRQHTENTAKT